jgi:hypothetical protein
MDINPEIEKIYKTTQQKFSEWAKSEDVSYRNAACPETLRGKPKDAKYTVGPAELGDPAGFQILWTPIWHKPKILICGSCPTSFGTHEDNVKYLKGEIPSKNIYIGAPHKFGSELTNAFADCGKEELFRDCLGLNIWHFQYVGPVTHTPYPDEVRAFCENNTKQIIELAEPEIILALGERSFEKLQDAFSSKIHQMEHPTSSGRTFREQIKALIEERFS